ncbi:magnesium transporter [Rhizomicrobium palustre]|uniref:Magnesium transport protein CorA n=1 Tax=Rhizomicrobium palustre TaxID=189966 RepID=A0A846MW37_9PROT|nr:magnesium transporter CorA family protein [Rhizomicrobium palustre]NIK87250.1 magnesium transporter [Rhizomicrobium palustre]
MLKTYMPLHGGLRIVPDADSTAVPPESLWIDLFDPSPEERQAVNNALGVDLPTRADMEEIEVSSRLYAENGAIYMTALVLANSGTENPVAGVVTFALVRNTLITIRYTEPQPFRTFEARCRRGTVPASKAENVLLDLLDVIIDRLADIQERASAEIERISRDIFDPDNSAHPISSHEFQEVLRALGRKHDLAGKIRESLLTLARMLAFLQQAMDNKDNKDVLPHVKTLTRDVNSLQDHLNYLTSRLSYLLDATLGLINIDQNNIIKIMSVAAMVFLPPTLFASIWGMNFQEMPELHSHFGYPIAWIVMIVSAIVPYIWFKRKGWL